MRHDDFRRLRAAPELLVIAVADETLRALGLAILSEHSLLQDQQGFIEESEPPVQSRARRILRRARRLRRALDAYRRELDVARQPPPSDDFPF